MQGAQLGEHVLVPVGVRAHHASKSSHTIRQPTDLRIDQARSQFVPRRVLRQHRIAQAGAHAILEPAIEFRQAGGHACDAIVASCRRIALGHGRRCRIFVRRRVGRRNGCD